MVGVVMCEVSETSKMVGVVMCEVSEASKMVGVVMCEVRHLRWSASSCVR